MQEVLTTANLATGKSHAHLSFLSEEHLADTSAITNCSSSQPAGSAQHLLPEQGMSWCCAGGLQQPAPAEEPVAQILVAGG